MGYQSITIMGNLTRDVEVRQVGQSSVAKTAVAVSERFKKSDGTVGESTEFFEIEIWDRPAANPYLTKGKQVLVVGQIKTEKWQDQNGQTRESKKIRVGTIQLCAKPQQEAPAQQPVQATAPPPQPVYQPAPAVGYQAPPQPPTQQQPPAQPYPPQPTYQSPMAGGNDPLF